VRHFFSHFEADAGFGGPGKADQAGNEALSTAAEVPGSDPARSNSRDWFSKLFPAEVIHAVEQHPMGVGGQSVYSIAVLLTKAMRRLSGDHEGTLIVP